jgi:hypothetical protein
VLDTGDLCHTPPAPVVAIDSTRGRRENGGPRQAEQAQNWRLMSQPVEIPRRPSVDVFALFAVEPDGSAIRDFLGTGFLLADGIVVTCWHCVHAAMEGQLAVAAVQTGGDFIPGHAGRERLGYRDCATRSNPALRTRARIRTRGHRHRRVDVRLPLTDPPNERRASFLLNARDLEGYITRAFYYSDARVPSYELDMRAPAGLSGAPLIEVGSKRVIGVVYGVHEAERIERFGRTDPDTGLREPELVRVETFALAHYTETLRAVVGPATGERPLGDVVDAAVAAAEREFRESPLLEAARRAGPVETPPNG